MIYVTLKHKKDTNIKFFIDIPERRYADEKYYLAFSSEFDYEIDVGDIEEGTVYKYSFTFDAKESYSPNPEVLHVIKYIEELTENIDSPISSVIYAADTKLVKISSEDLRDLNYYEDVSDLLNKVVYAIYLVNGRYESPLIGAELLLPSVRLSSRFITGPLGNSFTTWNQRKNPILIWNSRTKRLDIEEEDKNIMGIHIIQPEVPINDLLENIRTLNGNSNDSKFRHFHTLILRGLKSENCDFTWGNPGDYMMALFEINKSFPNQKKQIIKDLDSIGVKNLSVTAFDINQLQVIPNIIGWSDLMDIFKYLSESNFLWLCAAYSTFTLIDKDTIEISEKEMKILKNYCTSLLDKITKEFDNKIAKQILKLQERNTSIPNKFKNIQFMIELVISSLLKSDDESFEPIYTRMLDVISSMPDLNFSRQTILLIAKKNPDNLEYSVHNLSPAAINAGLVEDIEFESTEEYKEITMNYAKEALYNWYGPTTLSTEYDLFEKIVNLIKHYPEELLDFIINLDHQLIKYEVC